MLCMHAMYVCVKTHRHICESTCMNEQQPHCLFNILLYKCSCKYFLGNDPDPFKVWDWPVQCRVYVCVHACRREPADSCVCAGIGGGGRGVVKVPYLQATGSFWGSYQQPPYCTSTSFCPAGSGKLSLQHGSLSLSLSLSHSLPSSPPPLSHSLSHLTFASTRTLATSDSIVSSWRRDWARERTGRTVKDRERQTERGRETRLTYGQGVMVETRTFHLHVLSVSSFKGATSNQKNHTSMFPSRLASLWLLLFVNVFFFEYL